jgi:hypothetical protein
MRTIGWTTALLIAALWGAAEIRLPAAGDDARRDSGWRRTQDGWERSSQVLQRPVVQRSLHPSVVAGFEILAAIFALTAFPATTRQVPRSPPGSAATVSGVRRKRPRPVLVRRVSLSRHGRA